MVPTLQRRVRPQAPDDGRPLGHRRRRADGVAARLRAPFRLPARLHRLLRYLTPFLHVAAFAANLALLGEGAVCTVTLVLQLASHAAPGGACRSRPFRIARYYVLVTASIAAGLWDHLRHGAPRTWERRKTR